MITYTTSFSRLERKNHVRSRPPIPRLPLSQNISKASQTRNQPATNISNLTNTRRRLTNSKHRTSNHNPLHNSLNNRVPHPLSNLQNQSNTLLHRASTTQPNRRLHNRRRNQNTLANNISMVRLWNPHTKSN